MKVNGPSWLTPALVISGRCLRLKVVLPNIGMPCHLKCVLKYYQLSQPIGLYAYISSLLTDMSCRGGASILRNFHQALDTKYNIFYLTLVLNDK